DSYKNFIQAMYDADIFRYTITEFHKEAIGPFQVSVHVDYATCKYNGVSFNLYCYALLGIIADFINRSSIIHCVITNKEISDIRNASGRRIIQPVYTLSFASESINN
ncbi:MAG: hypothetical protein ACM3VS_05060, partial [Candidatus Dadabacteria bacterium]